MRKPFMDFFSFKLSTQQKPVPEDEPDPTSALTKTLSSGQGWCWVGSWALLMARERSSSPWHCSHPSLHCPGIVGSSLSRSSLPAQQRTSWCFVGIRSCTGSDEHQRWSKVSSKTMGSGTRWEEGRSGAFLPLRWGGWMGTRSYPIITSCSCHWHQRHQQRQGSYFCEAISSSPGVFLSQNCICIIKGPFFKIKPLSHTPEQSLCCQGERYFFIRWLRT